MAMQPRERNLAIATAVLASVAGIYYFVSFLSGPISARRSQRANLEEEVEAKQAQFDRVQERYLAGREAKLADWKRGTLGRDPGVATGYHNWISGLCEQAGMSEVSVVSNASQPRGGVFDNHRFTVAAEGTLEGLTQFMHAFYAADRLHQIRRVIATEVEGSSDLGLTISIEALSLRDEATATIDRFQEMMDQAGGKSPGSKPIAKSSDEEEEAGSRWLVESSFSLSDFEHRIVERNLFAAYKPPPPPPPPRRPPEPRPEPPKFDPSKHAYLTAIVRGSDSQREAWLIARTTGKRYELREGDTFEIGPMRGKIVRLNRRSAEIEIDGGRWLLPIGDNLHQTIELPSG